MRRRRFTAACTVKKNMKRNKKAALCRRGIPPLPGLEGCFSFLFSPPEGRVSAFSDSALLLIRISFKQKAAQNPPCSFSVSEQNDKPGYVVEWPSIHFCRRRQTLATYPKADGPPYAFCSVLLRMGFTCAPPVASRAVVSYTAFPPLRGCICCPARFISVALSLESPPPDVIWHPAL